MDAALAEGGGAPPPEPAPTPENGEVQETKESTPEMDGMLNAMAHKAKMSFFLLKILIAFIYITECR